MAYLLWRVCLWAESNAQHRHPPSLNGGLQNLSNLCFLNALLTCLSNCDAFMMDLNVERSDLERALLETFDSMLSSRTTSSLPVFRILQRDPSIESSAVQQDSQETLIALLDNVASAAFEGKTRTVLKCERCGREKKKKNGVVQHVILAAE